MRRLRYTYLVGMFFAALLLVGCSEEEQQQEKLPDGYGRLAITISTPEAVHTRAVDPTNPWLEGTEDERSIKSYHLLICTGTTIRQVISGTTLALEVHEEAPKNYFPTVTLMSDIIGNGTYNLTFYCLANFTTDMLAQAGLTLSNGSITNTTLPENFENKVMRPIVNCIDVVPPTGLPMTGKLVKENLVVDGTTIIDDPLILWRMMAKLEFLFTNKSHSPVQVKGIEVEPINLVSEGKGIYLISKDDLTLTDNANASVSTVSLPTSAVSDHGTVRYQPDDAPLTLRAAEGATTPKDTIFFYVNESYGTFTTTDNQYSLRFKIARKKPNSNDWYDTELRYGFTTPHNGTVGGFNAIRRNDWIHIPVTLTDWQLRLEAMPFVPIAGYPVVLYGNDGLTATFLTGGFIILQPFVKKNEDATWRDFSDPEVEFVSISWKNSDGTNVAEPGKILTKPFEYDAATQCIIGELNNTLGSSYASGDHKTTLTITVKLGPDGEQYTYTFSCNIILRKS